MKQDHMDKSGVLVSVIMPAYNAEQTIGAAIESILSQTWKNLEVIIINDGSSDNTANVINAYKKDSRIIVINQENAGCSNAKNTGRKVAKGNFIQYLDADDLLSANKIEIQVEALRDHESAVAVCRTIRFKNNPELLANQEIDTHFLYSSSDPLAFILNLYGLNGKRGMIQPNAFLVPRHVAEKTGSWDEGISPSPDEDGEYFCRVILASSGILYTPEPMNYYRTGNKNTLSKKQSYLHGKGALASIIKIKEHLLTRENSPRTRWILARHLSAFLYQYYPLYPDLIQQALLELKTIGFHHKIPIEGGAKFRMLARLIGMKNALKARQLLVPPKKNIRIALYHFNPLEWYPPAMNFIHALADHLPDNASVKVFTSALRSGHMVFHLDHPKVEIIRLGAYPRHRNALRRYVHYIQYNTFAMIRGLLWLPNRVLYFETLSALPACCLTIVFKKMSVLAHFHEYMTPLEYQRSWLNGKIHALEKKVIFPSSSWMSHTNTDRLKFFLDDNKIPFDPTKHFVFPNYPPKAWWSALDKKVITPPVRLVYLGSFASMDSLYIKELLKWVMALQGKATLDIYTFHLSEQVQNYVASLQSAYIKINKTLDYYAIPTVLKQYDIGIILYKATEKNVIYSEPNKLFEYLQCGLDVWYPKEMAGCHIYQSEMHWPKVLGLDFRQLDAYNLETLISRDANCSRRVPFSSEAASQPLAEQLTHS